MIWWPLALLCGTVWSGNGQREEIFKYDLLISTLHFHAVYEFGFATPQPELSVKFLGRFSHFINLLLMALQLRQLNCFCIYMKGIQNITKLLSELIKATDNWPVLDFCFTFYAFF